MAQRHLHAPCLVRNYCTLVSSLFSLLLPAPLYFQLKHHPNTSITTLTAGTSMSFPSGPESSPAAESMPFDKIGAGSCGVVFRVGDSSKIVKVAKDTGSSALRRDLRVHMATYYQIRRYCVDDVEVPQPIAYFPLGCREHTIFNTWYPRFAAAMEREGFLSAAQFSVAEHISPPPERFLELLIKNLCPKKFQARARRSLLDRDCLVRVFLGKVAHRGEGGQTFPLPDIALHLEELVEIGISVEDVARGMGRTMAVMHWAVRHDGGGVKFVLGGKRVRQDVPGLDHYGSDAEDGTYIGPDVVPFEGVGVCYTHKTWLFLLDFDQAKPMSMDEAGVQQAVGAMEANASYFPRPGGRTEHQCRAWKAFAEAYMVESAEVINKERLESDVSRLPRLFIRALVDMTEDEVSE
ncbi:hypothetical protein JDV02_007015 [Purpureocillium takamizusanense]|uniref:DUF3669 domain-containing protein n=1 Tax=Purpureocillium takamizusanense TaxID=2060973 RepID=A0A9Q8QHF1_9HYPO|nr:uncharacterized protein JDV02_007015 [Purpureocillium takamizusanense]UNI20979.1 hypothetical protein JDV02_007015 [Purpureocillium takamizusanense]